MEQDPERVGVLVAPLAGHRPLLIIVLDGMSHRVGADKTFFARWLTELIEQPEPRTWRIADPLLEHALRSLINSTRPRVAAAAMLDDG